jgi:hypothetical protein
MYWRFDLKIREQFIVEDEIIFLLDCDFYSDLRYALTENACILLEIFENLILEDKFLFIMSNSVTYQYKTFHTSVHV